MAQAGQQPQGTVKDQIEQQVGLMGMLKARQQQAAQQQQQQAVQMPTIPPGTPQPQAQAEPEPAMMARGGVARLPSRLEFKTGGIVAFANEDNDQVVRDEEDRTRREAAANEARQFLASSAEVEERRRNAEDKGEVRPIRSSNQPPSGVIPPRAAGPFTQQLVERLTKRFDEPKSYALLREEAAQKNPILNTPIGAAQDEYLRKLEQRDAADAKRFEEAEARRSRSDMWNTLLAAGEATRGRRGIGAFFGGLGRAGVAAEQAAIDRQTAQNQVMRDRELTRESIKVELEKARRAEAMGDLKAANDHYMKIEELRRDFQKSQFTALNTLSAQEASADESTRRQMFDVEQARIRREFEQTLAMLPQRESAEAVGYVEAYMQANPKATKLEALNAYMDQRYHAGAKAQEKGNQVRALNAAATALVKELSNVATTATMDPKELAAKQSELQRIRQMLISMGQPDPAAGQAQPATQGGTPQTGVSKSGKPIVQDANGNWVYQ
jgi:hypothetical protein